MSGVMSSALCFWLMHSLQSRPRLLFQKYMIATAVLILSECELRNEGTTYMDLSFEDESECGVCTVVGPPHCHRGRGLCGNPRPCFLRLISRPLQLQKRSMSQRAELSLHRCRLHKLCKVHLPCFPLQVCKLVVGRRSRIEGTIQIVKVAGTDAPATSVHRST
jgi:hypothetical protein